MLVVALYGVLNIEGSSFTNRMVTKTVTSPAHRLSCQDQRFHSRRRFDSSAIVGSDSTVHAGIVWESVR
jgi:hypothetical protein